MEDPSEDNPETPDNDQTPASESQQDEEASSSAAGSDASDSSDSEPIESLVAGREKRSNAGNRLSTLLDREEADDEVDLIFTAEEGQGEDNEFEDPDAHHSSDDDSSSSSSSDDEAAGGVDDLSGEKALQDEERIRRRAEKRKAGPTIRPLHPPKRVKINDAAPRPDPVKVRKKADRVSWLASGGDGALRASSRALAQQNKERTIAHMKAHEERRQRLIAKQEASARKKHREQVRPLTQAERLEEAAHVERLNSTSLSRWEEMEEERLRKQKARMEAMQNRKIDGPFIRFYSGPAKWVDGKLKRFGHTDITMTVDREKPVGKVGRPRKYAKREDTEANASTNTPKATAENLPKPLTAGENASVASTTQQQDSQPLQELNTPSEPVKMPQAPLSGELTQGQASLDQLMELTQENGEANVAADAVTPASGVNVDEQQPDVDTPAEEVLVAPTAPAPEETTRESVQPLEASIADADADAPVPEPAHEFTDSPATETMPDAKHTDMASQQPDTSNQADSGTSSSTNQVTVDEASAPTHTTTEPSTTRPGQPMTTTDAAAPDHPLAPTDASASADTNAPTIVNAPLAPPPPPPKIEHGNLNGISLVNFDPSVSRSTDLQRRVLFGWYDFDFSVGSLHNPLKPVKSTASVCALTAAPAKYLDPHTGLPYRGIKEYKGIQRLVQELGVNDAAHGTESKRAVDAPIWSAGLQAWVGRPTHAKGTPPMGASKAELKALLNELPSGSS